MEYGEMMRIIVVGGSGFIGREVVRRLLASKNDVLVTTRGNLAARSKGLRYLKWDGTDERQIRKEVGKADVIINLSGRSIVGRWTEREKRRLLESRVATTKAITTAISNSARKPSLFINASAIGYYGSTGKGNVGEEGKKGSGFLPGLCERWEGEAMKASSSATRVCTVRIGAVIGDGGITKMTGRMLSLWISPYPEGRRQWISWIAMDDLARLIEFIIRDGKISGAINATSPRPIQSREFVEAIEKAIGKRHLISIPASLSKALFGQLADEVLLPSQRIVPTKALSEGFRFGYLSIGRAVRDALHRN